ncbi:DUF1919 domain-containing protein [Helicobacter sp. MIT 05-5293]|uniref:DUF1919 domain-containing protein n=1 Tax=Helicobacter sp. MIT 05-5293 TaxID=1548149 RepID=UPI0013152C00|nr:DUF1919 domain-containing protein [Helicobacter sp. MIT 05-5293]
MRILSNNCIGGFLYQDYHLPYQTPLAMLQIAPNDFVQFLSNLDDYLGYELENIESHNTKVIETFVSLGGSANITFPVGKLGEIIVFFQHSKSFQEAKESWNRRIMRFQKDKSQIYVILNLMGYSHFMANKESGVRVINEFLELPYEKKILLHTDAKIASIYPNQQEVAYVGEIQNAWFDFIEANPHNRKNYHRFDFDKWLGVSCLQTKDSALRRIKSSINHKIINDAGGGGYSLFYPPSKANSKNCMS